MDIPVLNTGKATKLTWRIIPIRKQFAYMVSKSRKLGLFPFQHGLNGVEMRVNYILSGVTLQVLGDMSINVTHLYIGIITQVVLEPPIWEHHICVKMVSFLQFVGVTENNKIPPLKFKIDIYPKVAR